MLIPSVDPEERLLFSHTMLPGIYRAAVRYGYMDRIEHNAAFVQTMSAEVRDCLYHYYLPLSQVNKVDIRV